MFNAIPVSAFKLALYSALVFTFFMATADLKEIFVFNIYDKIQHLAAFVTLAFLADFAYPRQSFWWRIAAGLFTYGLLLEITQYFLPHRDFSLLDLATNAAGLMVYFVARKLLVPAEPGLVKS